MMKDYLATYTSSTDTIQYRLMARDLKGALQAAAYLTPKGYTLKGCVHLPEW